MRTKEQVKKGLLTTTEAMDRVSQDSHTYGWCARRSQRKQAVIKEVTAKKKNYRHKPRKA